MKKYRHIPTNRDFETKLLGHNCVEGVQWGDWEIPMWVLENGSDWQEVKEKDYEILKSYMCPSQGISNGRPFEVVTEVKRLSDNKVFKIGDKVTSDFEKDGVQGISSFVSKPNEGVCVKLIKPNVQGFVSYRKLKHIEHIKEPLFTTEDGKDIYLGDKYYVPQVRGEHKEWTGKALEFETENVDYGNDVKRFSTKEAAEEYILMNKPCLSINELEALNVNCAGSISLNRHELKQLVKSKI